MKKSLLCTALLSLLSATAQADLSNQQQEITAGLSDNEIHAANILKNLPKPDVLALASPEEIKQPSIADNDAADNKAVPETQLKPTTPAITMDCNYHIPPETVNIDPALILQWAEKATQQSFDLDHAMMSEQLIALKSCYTEQGWQSFNDALQKSGNMSAIKSEQLMVSSMVEGKPGLTTVNDKQWKINLPLQVVYQNNKEKLTQTLTIDLLIGRKSSGDLGIQQIIASPRVH